VAALRIVLAWYGCDPPAEEIRRVAGVSRDCANAGDIARTARHYGFTCRAFRREPEQLAELGFPLIVHTRFIHFSVLEGMSATSVQINDPSSVSHIEVPIEEFRETFTGIVLKVEPGPGYRKSSQPVRFYERSPFTGGGLALAGAAAFALASTGSLIGMAAALGGWAESGGLHRLMFPVLLSAATILRAGCGAGYRLLLERIYENRSRMRNEAFLEHLLSLPQNFFLYRMPDKLYETLQSIDAVTAARTKLLAPAAIELCAAPLLLAAVWRCDGAIAMALAALFLCAAGASLGLSRWRAGIRRRDRSFPGTAAGGSLFEGIERAERYKLGGHDRDFLTSVTGAEALTERFRQEHVAGSALAGTIPPIFSFCALTVTLCMGAFAIARHELSMGGLLSALVLTAALRDPLRRFVAARHQLEQIRLREPYIADVLACAADSPAGAPSFSEADQARRPAVRLDNVTFGYTRSKPPTVSGLSLEVHAGEHLGITGPSGGGKSTAAGLLAGLYQPWSGAVTLSGRAAWVSKTPYLMEGSIRENLLLWDESIEEEALREAIGDACFAEVLAGLPAGLETTVERDGRNLSGGQRQRLDIARALARRPALLILDEATDGLDAELEQRLRLNLRRRGCAVIFISHRAGTLAGCDRVVRIGGPSGQEDGGDWTPREVSADPVCATPLFEAFRQVAAAMGESVAMGEPAGCGGPDALAALARHNSLYYRRLRFTVPGWWRRDHGPLIAFSKATGEALPLIPGKTLARHEDLEPIAYQLYARPREEGNPVASLFRDGMRRARRDIVRAFCCVPAIAALCLVPAVLAVLLFSSPLPSALLFSRSKLAASLALFAAGLAMTLVAFTVACIRFEGRMRLSVPASFAQIFTRIPVWHIRSLTTTAAARAVAAVPRLPERVTDLSMKAVLDAVLAMGCAMFLLWMEPRFALFAALLAIPLIALPVLQARRGLDGERLHTHLRISQQRALYALLQSIAPLRVLGLTRKAAAHWRELRDRQRRVQRGIANRMALLPVAADAWSWGSAAALTVCGITAATPRTQLLPALFVVSWQFFTSVSRFAVRLAAAVQTIPLVEDASALLSSPLEEHGAPGAPVGPKPIEIDSVSYRYPGSNALVLDGVSLRIEPGQIVALTGPSGGGKSTLLRLLLGFDMPEGGEIRRHADLAAWREVVGAVFQDDRVEEDTTIRFQIAGCSPCGVDEVWRAAGMVGLAEYIRNLPMGLQNIIGPGKISTGQQQRILIARQLLRRPRLLILDEATGAIPEEMQARLFANLRATGLTTLLVTHRASAVALSDRVFVIRQGKTAFCGTPREFAAEGGASEMLKGEEEFAR
jgi:ABC-type bacteriocin/lantibiotic exporter with double-glycine peptidase domain